MYLHLGQDTTVKTKEIVGVFDLDTSTLSKNTREYLRRAEQQKLVVNTSSELPKSFVVTAGEKSAVYLSQLTASTLKKRVWLAKRRRF